MRRVALVLLPVALLTSCVAPSVRAPEPVQVVPVTVAPPQVAAPAPATDTGVEPGIWTYGPDPRGTAARFGMTLQTMVFAIQCDRATSAISLFVARLGQATGGPVTLRATTMVKSFPAESSGPYAIVRISARDTVLDALAFSRGRFGVAIDGVERAFPTWPEFTRVVEDCRA